MFSLWWTRSHRFVIFGPTESFRSNRSNSLGATDFITGKTLCHIFCVSSDPSPLNESCPLQASHFYHCLVLWIKDQTHSTDSRKPFLEIDVKGGERDHIKAYHSEWDHIRERVYHLLRGRKRSLGGENTQVESISQGSQMLGVQEERCHMSSWGERHVQMCLFALCSLSSDFFPYLLPVSHARFRGSKTSKGKKSFKFIAYLYSWGHV